MLSRVRRRQLSTIWVTAGMALALCLLPHEAAADTPFQSTSDELRLIESTERNLDPLGLDDATGAGLDDAARALQPKKVPDPVAESGDVLTAIAGVYESGHEVQIKLEAGLAFVEETLELSNRTRHTADAAYRLRVPDDAVLWAMRVCVAGRCRDALRGGADELASYAVRTPATQGATGEELPSAAVSTIREGEGRALAVHVGPIRARPVSVRVSYLSAAPIHGGHARFALPARGFDPRLVPTKIQVESRDLSEVSARPASLSDPSLTIEVEGALAKDARTLVHRARSTCRGAPCSREFRAAPSEAVGPRETWLVLDASPSMEGEARSRVPVVVAALLTLLPDATKVRAFAFAAQSEELGQWPAIEAPLSKLSDAVLSDLGAATHLSSVLERFHDALVREKPRVIVLSDGALDPSPREDLALERARHTGAELALVSLGEEPPAARIHQTFARGAGSVHLTGLADHALSQGSLDVLSERLVALLHRPTKNGQKPGEERVIERQAQPRRTGREGDDWLPAWLARKQRTFVYVAATPERSPAIAAPAYVDIAPPTAVDSTGLPKESVLDLLRTQLVPQARACLRSDRKGRADYAVGVTFRFLIARREVSDVSVEGDVKGALRECLFAILPRLRMPWFTGTLRVRYPIHTEREPEPPVIELAPEVEREVDRVIGQGTSRHTP